MSGINIAAIEGDEVEMKIIRERVLSSFLFDNIYTFETAAQFRRERPEADQLNLAIADLLEYYDNQMPDNEVYDRLADTFDQLLTIDNNPSYDILFLTKVPSSYVKESMIRATDFPHSNDTIEEKFNGSSTVMYNMGKLSIVSKPYKLDEDTGELVEYQSDLHNDIVGHMHSKFGLRLTH